jgi:hypothetical protein
MSLADLLEPFFLLYSRFSALSFVVLAPNGAIPLLHVKVEILVTIQSQEQQRLNEVMN